MAQRRRALIIVSFETQDFPLSRVEKGWNKFAGTHPTKHAQIKPTTTQDFLIARNTRSRNNKDAKPGFIEVELSPGESVMTALQRMNPFASSAIMTPWQLITSFPYKSEEVLVGTIGAHPDQRGLDLSEQSDELPFTVEWLTPGWILQQNEEGLLNTITSLALSKLEVQRALRATQQRAS